MSRLKLTAIYSGGSFQVTNVCQVDMLLVTWAFVDVTVSKEIIMKLETSKFPMHG